MLAEILLFSTPGIYCVFSQPAPTARQVWSEAEAVVSAVIESRRANTPGSREPYRLTARAYEAFKGAAQGDAFEFEGGIASCGGHFEVGEKWLLYLGRGRPGVTWGAFRRSKRLERAGEDFRFLHSLPDVAKVSRIAGTVLLNGEPVSNVVVTANDGSREMATISGLDGDYEFLDVPTGVWKLSAAPGNGLRAKGSNLVARGESTTHVRGADHVQVDFTLKPSGRIAGVLRDAAGEGVYGASVSPRWGPGRRKDVWTDRAGAFAFDDLEAGEYQVVAHAVGEIPAVVVQLTRGQRVEELEVPAGPMPKRMVITGQVTFPDGTPAGRTRLEVLKGRRFDPIAQTDELGRFEVIEHEGEPALVRASLWPPLATPRCAPVPKLLTGEATVTVRDGPELVIALDGDCRGGQ